MGKKLFLGGMTVGGRPGGSVVAVKYVCEK